MKNKNSQKRSGSPLNSDTTPHRNVNLKELAAHLGLSLTTVSRVMNQSAAAYRIAPETEERVLKAAALLNYEPNAFARGLRKRKSFTVGVMVPEISEGYAATVLGGIEDVLLKESFFYFVVSHHHRDDLLEGYPRLLLSRAVEGIIAVDTLIESRLPVPVVAVSGSSKKNGVLTVEVDHMSAARVALSHLAELGHQRIAFIKGQDFSSDTALRWNAIRKSCSSLGITIHPELVVQLEGTEPGSRPGCVATQKLLEAGSRFSALFAFNDASALGAITALHEAGLQVPKDVSIVGFDDIPSAAAAHPGLTTVRQPLHEMGQIAATSLLKFIREGINNPPQSSVLVSPSLVVRRSTGKFIGKAQR